MTKRKQSAADVLTDMATGFGAWLLLFLVILSTKREKDERKES